MNISNIDLKENNPEKVFKDFIALNSKENKPFVNLVFRKDERVIFGRRLQILYLILEGYKYTDIQEVLSCGRDTISKARRLLRTDYYDNKKFHEQLKTIFNSKKPLNINKGDSSTEKYIFGSRNP